MQLINVQLNLHPGDTQRHFIRGGSAPQPNPFYIPFLREKILLSYHIPSLELCFPFNCCKSPSLKYMKQSQNQNVFSTFFFTVTKSIFYSRLGLFTVRVTTDLPSLLFILSLKKLFIWTIYNILRILGVFYKDRVWVCSFPGQTNMSETTESVISSRENRKTLYT